MAALLNSAAANLFLRSLAPRVQTIEYMPSDVAQLAIPTFDAKDQRHRELVKCSRECHKAAASSRDDRTISIQSRVDYLAAQLWSLTDTEHAAVLQALADLEEVTTGEGEDESEEIDDWYLPVHRGAIQDTETGAAWWAQGRFWGFQWLLSGGTAVLLLLEQPQ